MNEGVSVFSHRRAICGIVVCLLFLGCSNFDSGKSPSENKIEDQNLKSPGLCQLNFNGNFLKQSVNDEEACLKYCKNTSGYSVLENSNFQLTCSYNFKKLFSTTPGECSIDIDGNVENMTNLTQSGCRNRCHLLANEPENLVVNMSCDWDNQNFYTHNEGPGNTPPDPTDDDPVIETFACTIGHNNQFQSAMFENQGECQSMCGSAYETQNSFDPEKAQYSLTCHYDGEELFNSPAGTCRVSIGGNSSIFNQFTEYGCGYFCQQSVSTNSQHDGWQINCTWNGKNVFTRNGATGEEGFGNELNEVCQLQYNDDVILHHRMSLENCRGRCYQVYNPSNSFDGEKAMYPLHCTYNGTEFYSAESGQCRVKISNNESIFGQFTEYGCGRFCSLSVSTDQTYDGHHIVCDFNGKNVFTR